jgi:hypothetical protein
MKTIIIDLDGNLTSFKPLRPFFYPLLRSGEVQIFAPGTSLAEKKKVSAQAEQWLLRRSSIDWQVIFLSPVGNKRETLTCEGCLIDRIDRIRNIFLSSWLKAALTPKHVWLISIDTWEVNGEEIPVSVLGRYHQELELKGYVSDSGPDDPVFSLGDIDQISTLWQGPFDLAGQHDDEGIGEIAQNIQIAVKESFDQAQISLEKIILSKKNSITQYSNDEGSRFFDKTRLDSLQQDFTKQLHHRLQMKQVGWLSSDQNPFTLILKDLLSVSYDTNAAAEETGEDLIVIRYPASEWHRENQDANNQHWQLLQLTYFLIFLVEKGKDVSSCKRNKKSLWQVKNISIDPHSLTDRTQQTIKTWQEAATQLHKDLQGQALVSAQLQVPPVQQCMAQFDGLRPEKIRGIIAEEDWNQWLIRQQRLLDNDINTAEQALASCRGRLRDAVGSEQHNEVDVDVMVDELGREVKTLREEIRNKAFAPITHGWPNCVQKFTQEVLTILTSTPTLLQKSLLLLVTGSVLLASYLFTACKINGWTDLQEPRIYLPAATLAGIVLLADLCLVLNRGLKKRSLLRRIFKELKVEAEKIKNMMIENAEYLWKISHLAVVTQNLRTLADAKIAVHEQREKKVYFLNALRGHDERLRRYADTPLSNQKLAENATFEIDFDRPEELQKIFALIDGPPVSYKFFLDGAHNSWSSNFLPGLTEIKLSSESSMQGEI